jgi:hypothetical protein
MRPIAALLLLILTPQEKDFGKFYTVKVQAKTRWAPAFKAEFDKEMKKHDDCLRERSRKEVPDDKGGWDEWTFDAAETWKYDIKLFDKIFGKHVIRRYDIIIEGTVKIDAQRTYHVTHAASGTTMKLANRPKLPKDKADPPDIRSKLEAAVKEGHQKFKISGEIIRVPTNCILMDSAEPVKKDEEEK